MHTPALARRRIEIAQAGQAWPSAGKWPAGSPAGRESPHADHRKRMPDQLMLPFYLWTRELVAQLIEREYGIKVSAWTVGRYLKAWGMSPRNRHGKPMREAMRASRAG
ncbi:MULTISPECIES: helix-turn-helix domain-containing protein [Paraburkholderia]|nr:winged helix-turn-helix domain-containing protein [Paraburkholderia phymatum]